jgi:hypothetical protein
MSYRNNALLIFLVAILCGALLGAGRLAPNVFSSTQTVSNLNTKANTNQSVSKGNKNQSMSPSRARAVGAVEDMARRARLHEGLCSQVRRKEKISDPMNPASWHKTFKH